MGSCNTKNTAINNAVSRVSVVSISNDSESIFTKRNSSFLDSSNPFQSAIPRRSSMLNLANPIESSAVKSSMLNIANPDPLQRRSSFNVTSSRTSLLGSTSKTESDCKLIKTALQKHFIFSSLTENQLSSIIKEMGLLVYPTQSMIFEQNSVGDNFFIISKGKVEVVINLKVAAVLKSGDSFGEVALLHETPRTATIITMQETVLWGLDRCTFRGILQDMSSQKYSENMEFIENIKIFKTLTRKQKESLANVMINEHYTQGSRVLREGDQGDFMFIIKEGTVIVTQKGLEIRKLGKNDYFGEQALLQNHIRTATITALETTSCLSINSEGLYSALGSHLQEIIHINTQRMAIDEDQLLRQLTPNQINDFISKTKVTRYKRGQILIPAGTFLNSLFIILTGTLSSRTFKAKSLQIIGSDAMIHTTGEVADNFVAIEDSDIAEISKAEFENAIGGRLADVIERNGVLKVIKEIGIFRGVELKNLEKVVRMLSVLKFRNQNAIVTQNQPGDSFFIVKNGNVEVKKTGIFVRNIGKNDYFGERSLLFNKNRSATVRALGDVECWFLTRSQFATVFDENMKQQLLERIDLQDTNVEIIDLCIVKTLHISKLANYFICINKHNQKLYVFKSMLRSTIVHQHMEKSIISQKKILGQIDHSFMIRLVKTFKDSKRLCMLLEYIRGVDFFTALKIFKKPDELDSRFYTGCLLLILEYLHGHGIIYRDLNLKNLIIDLQGYLKLVDFSCAKYIQGRTYTLIGTPHYIAPEVIIGHGYNISADYWSLGITLYQIMYGSLPFGNNDTDPVNIYQNIINYRLAYPASVDPLSKARDFISGLLNKDPVKRGTMEKLKAHPWFVGLNWEMLINKQIKAPFLPVPTDLTQEIHSAIKYQKTADEFLTSLDESPDIVIPRFNLNSRWDAEF